jgi:O-antigen ligase
VVSALYILAFIVLSALAFTKRRVWVLCGFYCVYGVLKLLALGDVLEWRDLVLFQGLYLVLFVSAVMRWFTDKEFPRQMARLPKAYFIAIAIMAASALYSISGHIFTSGDAYGIAPRLAIALLFLLSAAQMQRSEDLKIFAGATVFVSLVLSTWVIWSAFTLDFKGMRGGIDVNQNFVSVFVLAGAVPLLYALFSFAGWKRVGISALLLFVILGAFILASRGMIAAFAVAVLIMLPGLLKGKSKKAVFALGLSLVFICGLALALPGGSSIIGRFDEGDLETLNGRTQVWHRAIDYFGDGSIGRQVIGYGLSSGQVILPSHLTDDLWNFHNQYLAWLVEQGFIGLIAFGAFLFGVFRVIQKSKTTMKPMLLGWLALLMVGCLTGTLADIHPFWVILGVSASQA